MGGQRSQKLWPEIGGTGHKDPVGCATVGAGKGRKGFQRERNRMVSFPLGLQRKTAGFLLTAATRSMSLDKISH